MGKAKPLPVQGISRILVRGTNWIGDVVMTLPALAAIRRTLPGSYICVLAKPWVADLYKLSPDADEVLIYRSPGVHQGLLGKLALAGEIRQRGFDLAILLQNAIEAAIIAKMAGIPLRAGYKTDGRGLLLTHPVSRPKQLLAVHQTKYYLEMLKGLGFPAEAAPVALNLPSSCQRRAEEILNSLGVLPEEKIVGMAVGAAYGPAKKWFPERFAEVADRLHEDFGIRVILFGSLEDRRQTGEVSGHARSRPIDLAGRTTLSEAIGLIARCRLFISNDSGLMHISGALGVPTLVVFGSTNPRTTSPLGERTEVIYHQVECSPCLKKVCPADFRCMDVITADEVYQGARRMLLSSGSLLEKGLR